ncbi:DAK2 domain-containing protein [Streptomyces thermocarboxydus]
MGGASGPCTGRCCATGKTLGEAAEVDRQQLAEALRAGVDAVMKLGRAAPGDKTMIDALLRGARRVVHGGAGRRAGRRGRDDADAARKGRASYLGERSIGHQDPGATSSALLIAALLDAGPGDADAGGGEW